MRRARAITSLIRGARAFAVPSAAEAGLVGGSSTALANDVLHDRFINNGAGFTIQERHELGLFGLVPPTIETLEREVQRAILHVREADTNLHKYMVLSNLYGTNVNLFFKLLLTHIEELLPIVYTPTVGEACQKFGQIFQGFHGMYFSVADRGKFRKMMDNWRETPDILVATDGGRILGLGDQGAGGMGIPIGKLQLYVAGGGFHPRKTLAVQLDVGTDRESLLEDEFYLGTKYKRLKGEAHEDLVEEFVTAIHDKWPDCIIQFEDFQSEQALYYLEKYRDRYVFFNDDIQGTAAILTAGFINGMKVQGTPVKDAKILMFGAGSSACGCAGYLVEAMVKAGLPKEEAKKRIFMVDSQGLITKTRPGKLNEWKSMFAQDAPPGGQELKALMDTIEAVKPNAIFGLTGSGPEKSGWNKEVIEKLTEVAPNNKPLIFPLSNPTTKAEVSHENAVNWSKGRCLFSAGSPFPPVEYEGKTHYPSQCNNMFIFPGVGMAAKLSRCTSIPDSMLIAAAYAVSDAVSDEFLAAGRLYPPLSELREVGKKIVAASWKAAHEDGVAKVPPPLNVESVIDSNFYVPSY